MDIQTVAVIGAGTMGAGIAQVCAQSGWETRLYDAFPHGLAKGMTAIDAFWDRGIERGKISPEQKFGWSGNLNAVSDMAEAVAGADLIIEAVPEVLPLKMDIFTELEQLAPSHAVLATNTSSLPVRYLAAATNCPERVIGMHFFNPVPLMELLELVRHDKVSKETIAAAESIGSAMGKTTILVRDVPGLSLIHI